MVGNPPVWFSLILIIPFLVVAGVLVFKCPKCTLTAIGCLLLVGMFFFWVSPAAMTVKSTRTASMEISASPSGSAAEARVMISFPTTEPAVSATGKLWVDNWEAFINGESHRYLRAGTPEFGVSEQEARQQARARAAQALLPYVVPELKVRLRPIPGTSYLATDDWVRNQIEASINRGAFIKDEQVVRVSRPYGDVWTAQVLVDASPQAVQRAAQEYGASARRQAESTAVTWGGLGALTLVIVLTYAFLNWMTKGYFVWRLRAAAVMVVILALLAVMALA
jgi:hypothetical protein